MALQLYTLASVYVNGALLAEEASVGVDRDSRAQEVATVAKGFAGMSLGAATTRITVDNGVPAAAIEMNPGQFFSPGGKNQLSVVELSIFAAGKTLTTKGFIISDNFTHAVNSEAKIRFTFLGEPSDWQ